MNPDNYCSLEMSRKLVGAGIVLETDFYWTWDRDAGSVFVIKSRDDSRRSGFRWYPAPSMAEVWRELPIEFIYETRPHFLFVTKKKQKTYCGYAHDENAVCGSVKSNINPTDALIDLLIWMEGEKR